MAYAKTTPVQVISQLLIGASVGSLAWFSLRPGKAQDTLQDSLEKTTSTDPLAALEAETRATTTGQLWGLPPKQDSLNSKLVDSPKKS
jgi:hypothetical protein